MIKLQIINKLLLLVLVLLLFSGCSSKKDAVKKTPVFKAEESFNQANDKIDKGRYEDAREILERIKTQDITGEYSTLAQIRIGDTFFKEGLYEEASVEYEHFLSMRPHHKYSSYVQYQIAMTYFKRIETIDVSYSVAQKALKEFEKLLHRYPRNPYIDIVENRIKRCKNILAEYEFYVGEFYFKKGSHKAAAGRFDKLVKNYPNSRKEAESLYYLGVSYKNLGDMDKSIEALTSLIEKYPTVELAKEAKEIIASFNKIP